jgi:putative membrane protein
MTRILTLAALAAFLAVGTARAQSTNTHTNAAAVNDWLFAEAAHASGMAELAVSELGAQRATDPELKKFSQQMVQEHSRINNELAALAWQRRVALPRTLDVKAQFCSQNLAGLSGEQFDRCYAKAQLAAHMEAVAAFEAEAERGQDPAMKSFAAKELPHIKEHLKSIKQIAMKFEKEKDKQNESEKSEK